MSGQQMEFPATFEEFAKDHGFKDDKEVYTNGSDLIPVFRVKQWLEHDNKLRAIETDTAYECGKHANGVPELCEDAISRKEVFETFGDLLGVWGRKALMEMPPVTPAVK